MPKIAGETEPDTLTGWWRVSVWEDDDAGLFGDGDEDTEYVGMPYSSEYTNGEWKSIVAYTPAYVTAHNQPGSPKRYIVEGAAQTWKINMDEGGYDHGNDTADFVYDLGSVLYFETQEQAQAEARRAALNDESYTYTP